MDDDAIRVLFEKSYCGEVDEMEKTYTEWLKRYTLSGNWMEEAKDYLMKNMKKNNTMTLWAIDLLRDHFDNLIHCRKVDYNDDTIIQIDDEIYYSADLKAFKDMLNDEYEVKDFIMDILYSITVVDEYKDTMDCGFTDMLGGSLMDCMPTIIKEVKDHIIAEESATICEGCDEEGAYNPRHECGCKMLCVKCVVKHDSECEGMKKVVC